MAHPGEVHPDLGPLAFLLGEWEGEGVGEYPTIASFAYREVVTFRPTPKPFLAYRQQTWALDDGRPLHAETGYWRLADPDRVEVVLAHPMGLTEVLEGSVAGRRVRLASTSVARTTSAKRVDGVERDVEVDDHALHYRLRMAAVGEPMTHHLAATLLRR